MVPRIEDSHDLLTAKVESPLRRLSLGDPSVRAFDLGSEVCAPVLEDSPVEAVHFFEPHPHQFRQNDATLPVHLLNVQGLRLLFVQE